MGCVRVYRKKKSFQGKERACRAYGLYMEKYVQQKKVMINIWQWITYDFKCAISVIYRGACRPGMETRPK